MSKNRRRQLSNAPVRTSWEPVAEWYYGWVGQHGSKHHRQLAIPAILELLELQAGARVLEVGAGHGVLAPYITQAGAQYTGVEASQKLVQLARKLHGHQGKFLSGDACRLFEVPGLYPEAFDAVVFLLSIQDMEPLPAVLTSASWALKSQGQLAILMTHPCFRVPRQSGWGWDEKRKLRYRRVDRYLSTLRVPMQAQAGQKREVTLSFHRPLGEYINCLAECGLLIDRMEEIPTYKVHRSGPQAEAINLAHTEIPLFLGLRARKASITG
jgi:SAM-dependent methyltransferase